MNSVCEDCLPKPGPSNEDIVRRTGGASEEVMTLMIFMTNNNDDRQSDADNCEESEDEDEVEDRMCECR